MPNISGLDRNPATREELAQLLAEGHVYKHCAEVFEVSTDTIKRWVKDKRVQQLVSEKRQERINRITRKTDSRLEAMLDNEHVDLSVEQIIAIRRALAPAPTSNPDGEAADLSVAETDLYRRLNEAVAEHPELAEKLGIELPTAA